MRYIITFMDGEKEEVIASKSTIYTDDMGRIGRISFYDSKENLTACYSGDWVKSYRRIERED